MPIVKVYKGGRVHNSAAMHNATVDLINASKRSPGRGGLGQIDMSRDTNVVYVKNVGETDAPWLGVLGVHDALFTPDDNEDGFKARPVLCGTTPDVSMHRGKFVICLEPIASQAIGRAVIAGVIAVQVNVNAEEDGFADVLDGDVTQLDSGHSGAGQILYKPSGTGTKWAIVRVGLPALRGMFPVTVENTGGDAGDATTQCTFVYTVADLSGNELGTGLSPAKPRPALGAQVAQAGSGGYGTGFYDADGDFVLWDAGEVPAVDVCGDECEDAQ